MTPTDKGKPKATLIIGLGPKDGPPPLSSPEMEPDADDAMGGDSSSQSCASCYAFQPSTGRCLMFPPHGADWSMVDESDWCCQYKSGKQHEPNAGQSHQMPSQQQEPPNPYTQGAPR